MFIDIYIYIGAWLGLFSCEDLELFIKILELLIKVLELLIKVLDLLIKVLELFDVNPAVMFKFIGIFVKFLESYL